MVKNMLENIEYVEPNENLPVPLGMCRECLDTETVCDTCKEINQLQ